MTCDLFIAYRLCVEHWLIYFVVDVDAVDFDVVYVTDVDSVDSSSAAAADCITNADSAVDADSATDAVVTDAAAAWNNLRV